MIDTTFSKQEISLLHNIINHSIQAITSTEPDAWNYIYGNVCLKFDNIILELNNEEETISFYDGQEDIALFKLKQLSPAEIFYPLVINSPVITTRLNQKVEKIIIVEDEITTKNSHGELLYAIKSVTAIIFKTAQQYITFGREWFFSENISYNKGASYLDKIYPISNVIENWTDAESDITANCQRTFLTIK